MNFGSFARRTKMQPIDDIDLIVLVHAGSTIPEAQFGGTWKLRPTSAAAPLYPFRDQSGYVNSTAVTNAIKKAIEAVPQYGRADIGKNGSAIVLNLKSYAWSFDVVPACGVNGQGANSTAHYLVPDGSGAWKPTDPRIDADRATNANGRHGSLFLPAARMMKYWNRRGGKPRVPSYCFETLLTNRALTADPYPTLQNALCDLVYGVSLTVTAPCQDAKGYDGDLSIGMDGNGKARVRDAASAAYTAARSAIDFERAGNMRSAIARWREVFGDDLPAYS